MAVKSSPRGKRSKPHCLEVELVKTACGAAAGVVEVERRAAAVRGGAADTPEEVAGCTARRNKGPGGCRVEQGTRETTKGVMEAEQGAADKSWRMQRKPGEKEAGAAGTQDGNGRWKTRGAVLRVSGQG